MIEQRPRCPWAGADRPTPDGLMVAYHDGDWGLPCHDDLELFERLALESFQAGLSWSTILRKREAFRTAFRGFDPSVVAGFDGSDRERLMADAGIVRNRAKIDATIGNATAFLETAAEFGSFDAYLTERVPPPPARLSPDATARVQVRRLHDRVCIHAERRARRRPPAGVLPLSGLTEAPQRSRRSNHHV